MEPMLLKASRLFKTIAGASRLLVNYAEYPRVCPNLIPDRVSIVGRQYNATHIHESKKNELEITKKVIDLVNQNIEANDVGRLFAVVQVCGKQFKVTTNDIIVTVGYWPPTIGDEIRLEKVLILGSTDFTLVGRPILPLDQVRIKATVIEKAMTHTKTRFKYVKRKQYKRIQFMREPLTYLRINSIELRGGVDKMGDVDGTMDRIF